MGEARIPYVDRDIPQSIVTAEQFKEACEKDPNFIYSNEEKIVAIVKNFDSTQLPALAEVMIAQGNANFVLSHFEKFTGLLADLHLMDILLANGAGRTIIKFADKFSGVTFDRSLADKFIANGAGSEVFSECFKDVQFTKRDAISIIQQDSMEGSYEVFEHIERFSESLWDEEMVKVLVETRNVDKIIEHFDKFPEAAFTQEMAQQIVLMGEVKFVVDHLSTFHVDQQQFATFLIERGQGEYVLLYRNAFSEVPLDLVLAREFIAKGYGKNVLNNLDKFSDVFLNEELACLLLDHVDESSLYSNRDVLLFNLHEFKNLGQSTADRLIAQQKGEHVLRNSEVFDRGIFNRALAEKMVSQGQGAALLMYPVLFKDIEPTDELWNQAAIQKAQAKNLKEATPRQQTAIEQMQKKKFKIDRQNLDSNEVVLPK